MTVSCAEGDTGFIYAGALPFERTTTDLGNMPPAPLKIMMNVANPDRAFDFGMLPNAGHRPGAAGDDHRQPHRRASEGAAGIRAAGRGDEAKIDARIAGYANPVDFYVDRLAEGIATITASVAPKPVIVRPSGLQVERIRQPDRRRPVRAARENPMIGFRGAALHRPGFRTRSRWNAGGRSACARTWASTTCG